MNNANLTNVDFSVMTNGQMASWFGVNRFASREVAMKRCNAKLADMIAEAEVLAAAARAEADAARASLTAAQSEVKQVESSDTHAVRSAAIAASWKDVGVAARRLTRNAVTVDGEEYKSIPAAFAELGLNESKMIKTRLAAKKTGSTTYVENGVSYFFEII